jgi:SHS2 domain-containing protein
MEPEETPFEILDHPADVGFLAHGRTLEELFANAALAMMALAYELKGVEEREQREIEAEGEDTESLLYDWLSAILAVTDTERLVFKRFEIETVGARGNVPLPAGNLTVRGTAWGEPFEKGRHRARTYVKAVTLHQFEVRESERGWTARVYLDV